MKRASLKVSLRDAVVLSERDATGGGHRTLRHIPGSVLLGVVAAKLYRQLSPEDAFVAFHSGLLRFLPGMPSPDGRTVTWPVPICLHHPKADDNGVLHNACFPLPRDDLQRVALREGFVDAQGRRHRPETIMVTKTAIDGTSGSAADGQLFSYECLAPGQVFVAGVEADDGVPAALFDAVLGALLGSARLGRSRSAEFGRVLIESVEEPVTPSPTDALSSEGAVWLLSDLAALDANGQPTVQPGASDLGLPGAIDWSRSFVRTRRYAPWNAHRGGYDTERLVLQAGSVLWLSGVEGGLHSVQRSVGRHTESGLGRVWIAPPLLAGPTVTAAVANAENPKLTPLPATPLLAWFLRRGGQADAGRALDLRVEGLEEQIAAFYTLVARELAPPPGVPVGPSSSQWRDVARLAEAMEQSSDEAKLLDALFHETKGIARRDRPGWSDPLWEEGGRRQVSFSASFHAILKSFHERRKQEVADDASLAATLALLARRMSKRSEVGVRTENRRSSEAALPEVRR